MLHSTICFEFFCVQSTISYLSGFKSCPGSEDEHSEVSLTNKILKKLLEGTTPNSVVPPTVVVGIVLLRFRMSWIMLEWLRALHPGLALDDAEDLVNRKL